MAASEFLIIIAQICGMHSGGTSSGVEYRQAKCQIELRECLGKETGDLQKLDQCILERAKKIVKEN